MQDNSELMDQKTDIAARKRVHRLSDYPHHVREVVRYRDMDAQAHVNNAIYSTWFESGRVIMLRAPDLSVGVLNGTFVLARSEIDFLRELRWPGEVVIGSAIAHFGNRSFVMEQAVFQEDVCAAAGRMVLVMLDTTTRQPAPLTPELVARLSEWKLRPT